MGTSVQQSIVFAYNAGFRGEQIVTIVSISMCECGSQACQCNYDCCPASQSCGNLQIFQAAHPGTAACAVDPACAYTLGWGISSQGTNWHPWTTYNNGCYQSHTAVVRAALAAMGPPYGPGPPTCNPACSGGASCVNLQCVCPSGTVWNGASCVTPPPPPPCAGGCPAGTSCANNVCVCDAGTGWNGAACVPMSEGPPPGSWAGSIAPLLILLSAAGLGYYEAHQHRAATSRILHDPVPFGARHDHLAIPHLSMPHFGGNATQPARGRAARAARPAGVGFGGG